MLKNVTVSEKVIENSWIHTKIEWVLPWPEAHPSTKFRADPSCSCCLILITIKQMDRGENNLPGGGIRRKLVSKGVSLALFHTQQPNIRYVFTFSISLLCKSLPRPLRNVFFLILRRWRIQPRGTEASVPHKGIKMLFDCFQSKLPHQKICLEMKWIPNPGFSSPCWRHQFSTDTHAHTHTHICSDHNSLDRGHIYFLTPDPSLTIRFHRYFSTRLWHTCTHTHAHTHTHGVIELKRACETRLHCCIHSPRSDKTRRADWWGHGDHWGQPLCCVRPTLNKVAIEGTWHWPTHGIMWDHCSYKGSVSVYKTDV